MHENDVDGMWCPFARVADGSEGGSYNRTGDSYSPKSARCIGSPCMAWRYIKAIGDGDTHGRCGLVPVTKEDLLCK